VNACVLDASVAAKWFLPAASETLVAEALGVLEQYANGDLRVLVPDLFWAEFGNLLWKSVRLRRITARAAHSAIASLAELHIPSSSCMPLLEDALYIATAFDHSVYDAMYVALAVTTNRPLLTADERLVQALASRFPVRWLGAVAL